MTCRDSALPWKRWWMVLMVALFFLLQVDGWTLTKPQSRLLLPLDFPLFRPFYRVVALPPAESGPGEDHLSFTLRRQRVHLHQDSKGSAPYKKHLIEIDAKNGSIWMIKRPKELDVYAAAMKGGQNPRLLLTATVLAGSDRTDLVLEFTAASFCRPSLLACLPFSAGRYRIPEETETRLELDYLQNLAFRDMCPDTEVGYQIVSDADFLSINHTTGALLLSRPLDFEETPSISFNATCTVGGEKYATAGEVGVGDSNDNPPTTQEGNSTDVIVHRIRPGQTSLHFPVTAKDRDSFEDGGLRVRTEEDRLHLFRVEDVKVYGGLGEGRETFTFLQAEIKSKGLLQFPGREYNFSVVIEDVKLKQEERQVTYHVVLINDTDTELVLKDMYEVNISRNAGQYARILELSRYSLGYSFNLSVGEKFYDFLAVTRHMGIVHVKDPSSIPSAPSSVRRNILWKGPHGRSGSILLILNIQDDNPIHCESSGPRWCSYNSAESDCVSSCGIKGSRTGLCSWRPGSLTETGPRPDYATCSPDLNSCPDSQCDDLESMERTLCPQDCAKQFSGEVVPSKSGRGLSAAVGPCHCPAPDHCICVRNYPPPPAQMRRHHRPGGGGSTPAIVVEIYNETEKKHAFVTSSTMDPVTVLAQEAGVCGIGCGVVVSSVVVASVVLAVYVAWRVRCFVIHPKSEHVSLSGVQSDYVDEESRNTPSDTSSFGKTSMGDSGRWEFPRSRLRLQCVLGEGEFGRVVKAHALDIQGTKGYTTVAVKMLKENGGAQEKQDLMMEFMLLKEISHPNVVRLLGASTEKSGPFYLIVEFAEMGSLRSYLRRRRRRNCCSNSYPPPTYDEGNARDYYQLPCSRLEPGHVYFHKEQLSFSWQIAKGMAYLADMKLVHRDLAARNILLAKRKVVKISDFGLSRDIYEGDAYLKKSRGRVPVKWMAIESLEDQIYTSRSDVWSFGVVLWEIMMQGATPYPGVTPQRLYNLLKAGYRMTKPDNCSDEMYYLMRQCWRMPPRDRPSFKELVLKLEFLLQDTVEYMDFVSKERYQRMHSNTEIKTSVAPAPTIQYTSVLVEKDEEEEDEEEVNSDHGENIGLVRLFNNGPLPFPASTVVTPSHT